MTEEEAVVYIGSLADGCITVRMGSECRRLLRILDM